MWTWPSKTTFRAKHIPGTPSAHRKVNGKPSYYGSSSTQYIRKGTMCTYSTVPTLQALMSPTNQKTDRRLPRLRAIHTRYSIYLHIIWSVIVMCRMRMCACMRCVIVRFRVTGGVSNNTRIFCGRQVDTYCSLHRRASRGLTRFSEKWERSQK